MLEFTFQFMKAMIVEWKKELSLVLVGMILCICVILNFTDSVFDVGYLYGWDSSSEAINYNENRVNFIFSDAEGIEEIVDAVYKVDGVSDVFLKATANDNTEILSGTKVPYISSDGIVTGHVPESLAEGEVIVSLQSLQTQQRESIDENSMNSEYVAVGENVTIDEKEFTCTAEINELAEFVLNQNDFLELYRQGKLDRLTMYYIYENGFTKKEEVKNLVDRIKAPEAVEEEESRRGIEWSEYMESIQDMILGMIVAVLNAMFLYVYVLERRIPSYSILKLQGISNGMLRVMLFLEFLVLYLLAFCISGVGYGIYSLVTSSNFFNTAQVYFYTFMSLLILHGVIFWLLTWKLVRRQPFEIYSYR